jgi:RNA polymerase sigma factor (sigma-70 family)
MSPSVSVRLLLTQSDARLTTFARAGHERAFEALVQRYRRQLHGYCRRLLLSDERAEDALQQALLQAWLALRAGAEVGDVRSWLYRIVHNSAVNALRVSGYDYCKLSESLSGADAPQADLDRRIAVREALAGLAALPEMQREALLRTAVEGRSHQQVARDLGLSENALRGLVYRARATLRAAAGALTPPPLVGWALGGARGTPAVERLAEVGVGSGSAGIAGLLTKGGTVAVTAGVLAGGVVTVHLHPGATVKRSIRQAPRPAHSTAAPLAMAAAQPVRWTSVAHTRAAPVQGEWSPVHSSAPGPIRVTRQPNGGSPRRLIASPLSPAAPNGRRSDGRKVQDGGERNAVRDSGSNGGANGEAVAGSGSATGQRDGNGESGSDGAGSGGRDGEDGRFLNAGAGSSSGNSTSGGSGDGTSGPSTGGQDIWGSSGGVGDRAVETGQPGEPHYRQSDSGTSSSTRTNSSSKNEQSAAEEAAKQD